MVRVVEPVEWLLAIIQSNNYTNTELLLAQESEGSPARARPTATARATRTIREANLELPLSLR